MILEHLVFAVRCPACELTSASLCDLCRDEIEPWQASACLRCGADDPRDCMCDRLPDAVSWVRACWRFDGPVVDLIELAKYRGDLWRLEAMRPEVTGWLGAQLTDFGPDVAAVPVPPSPRRFRRRGFDVPLMLAAWLVRWPDVSLRRWTLRRIGRQQTQAGQDREARLLSVAGAFRARRSPPRVILIDDVITTGATVCACAHSLAAAGAREIGIVALARTGRER